MKFAVAIFRQRHHGIVVSPEVAETNPAADVLHVMAEIFFTAPLRHFGENKNTYAEEWITAPLTREMIQDVDHSTVLDSGVIDSATGKTTLVEMIREYEELGPDSGIELQCEKDCVVLSGRQWEKQLSNLSQSVVFIDEGNAFTASKEFAAAIQKTDNYYVLVTREGLETLPYSVTEIYGIRASKHFGDLKQTYNEFFRIYGKPMGLEKLKPAAIITEDSNSGFQFFQAVCAENGIFCESAGGKSNIFKMLSDRAGENVLVVADGAAFGSQMERIMQLLALQPDSHIYLPESFEWLILRSGLLEDTEVDEILKSPENHVESQQYFSWERYFTAVLMQKTADSYLKYTKSKLNPVYLQEHEKKAILSEMSHIQLDKKDI